MKEQQPATRVNGKDHPPIERGDRARFPAEIRAQVLKEYNTPSLWTGKQAKEREAALDAKYKLGRGTLQYWVRRQTGWVQPQSKKTKPHVKGAKTAKRRGRPKKNTTAIVVHAATVVPSISGHRESELLLRAVQRSLDRKRPSELTADELTTLLALRNLEGRGR